ncbi:MAG: tyrosine--tRNA ligase [Bacteroidota bacterium]|nr:tyrosine--tRNA ligase [Bacteroidota bacterium]MDP4229354.1 tyrosine--tRNA ligase [Bacteroidota bacterium]
MSTKNFPPLNEQMDAIRRGTIDLINEEELAKKISKGRPLVAKLGADPSSPDLHLGHAVVLGKLRTFQDLGHEAHLIVGDFTAMIGDPSGRSKTRPMLTVEETRQNGKTYIEQVSKVLSNDRLVVHYNNDWLGRLTFPDVIKLAGSYTVSQMLEREDFHKRFNEEQPISLHEFLYPLAQAMDSVEIRSDIELGGTDQKFNLLVGRELQRHFDQEPQCILTMPLLEGTDGVRKMSKSYGNSINFNDSADEMFGKTMSIPDSAIYKYFLLATKVKDIAEIKSVLESGEENPRNIKVRLAQEIIRQFYDPSAADNALQRFEQMFVKKETPDDIEVLLLPIGSECVVVDLMVETKMAATKSEARRLIQGGGVSLNGEKVSNERATLIPTSAGVVLKVGKRRYLKVKSA